MMEHAFAGQRVSFTPAELEDAVVKDGGVENFLLSLQIRTNAVTAGTPCNFTNWKKIILPYVKLVEAVGTEAGFNEAWREIESSNRNESKFEDAWNKTDRRTQHCLDQFPSMICRKGRRAHSSDVCDCGKFSQFFNYTAIQVGDIGNCVAEMGSVCTSMHGPVTCAQDSELTHQCEQYPTKHSALKHTGRPSFPILNQLNNDISEL